MQIAGSFQRCLRSRADRCARVRGNKADAQPSDNRARVVFVQAAQLTKA